jgi:TPR repeat protein
MTIETSKVRRHFAASAWVTATLSWLGALTLSSLSTAAAPACKDGKVPVDGSCCWPEQRVVDGRCEGPPRCPSGRIASKGDCLSRANYAEDLGVTCAKLEFGLEARPPEDSARRACDELAGMLADAEPGWTKACDRGDPAACLLLGGARQGYRTASSRIELWVARCPSNDCNGVRRSAERLGFAGTKSDPAVAKRSFERACKENSFAACAELAQGGAPKGFYRDLCLASGDPAACTEAGYQLGIVGRVADAELASAIDASLAKSCAGGSGLACNNLGFFIERKLVGDRTPRGAAQRYREACDRGTALGCANLVLASVRTPALPRGPGFEAAAKVLEAACDVAREERHQACFAFGYALQRGLGRKADPRRGQKLHQELCTAGFPDACGR